MHPHHPHFLAVHGRIFRAVDPEFRAFALTGSVTAGRYSRPDEPALYLSSSREGVEAALIAHRDSRHPGLEIIELDVVASSVVDPRDADARASLGIDPSEPIAPWQELVAEGKTPPSWVVRDRLVDAGADGVIDPSRQRPRLWHLVLFRWNDPGAPTVRVLN